MDVARILVRTKYTMILNEAFNMEINNNVYRIKLVEDEYVLKRILMSVKEKRKRTFVESEDSEETSDKGVAYGTWRRKVTMMKDLELLIVYVRKRCSVWERMKKVEKEENVYSC